MPSRPQARRPLPPAALLTRPARAWRWVTAALVAAVLVLALMPQPPAEVSTGWDKLNHLLAFCALAFAGRLGWTGRGPHRLALVATLVAFGGLIEVAQAFVPGRAADGADLLADVLGAGLGLGLAAVAQRLAGRAWTRA